MSRNEGYVYVSDAEGGVLAQASAGARVSLPNREPPWIVVDHAVDTVIVAPWPGRLWRVRIVDADGVAQVSAHANYTCAVAVDVLEELPASRLFGEHGDAVCSVLARAAQLDAIQANVLARARHPDAAAAYSRAWDRWLAAVDPSSIHRGDDLGATLDIQAGSRMSPINRGFIIIHRTVSDRAASLLGPSAFIVDEEGDQWLEPTWSAAAAALTEAAMAFGAPTLCSEGDRIILTTAWRVATEGGD